MSVSEVVALNQLYSSSTMMITPLHPPPLTLSLYGFTEEDDDNQDYIRDGFVVDEDEEEKERKIKKKLAKRGDLVDSDGKFQNYPCCLVE
jgi:hypothetical protein